MQRYCRTDKNQYLGSENSHFHSEAQQISMHKNGFLTKYLEQLVNGGTLFCQGRILFVWDPK